jgi:hypothetical protein
MIFTRFLTRKDETCSLPRRVVEPEPLKPELFDLAYADLKCMPEPIMDIDPDQT